MRAALAPLALALAAGACGGEPEIRTDDPAFLVEDLARALRPAARAWLADAEARDESATLGHPSSAEISVQAIAFQRLVQRGRALVAPHLPPETRGLPVPPDLGADLRGLAAALGASARADVGAAIVKRTPSTARVRLALAPADRPAAAWLLDLTSFDGGWTFVSAPRRE